MVTKPRNKNKIYRLLTTTPLVVAGLFLIFGTTLLGPIAHADTFDEQIRRLNQLNAQNQQANSTLEAEEANLQAVLDGLRSEINAVEEQIRANSAQRNQTNVKIAEAEAELVKQREALGSNIRAMYVEGDMSTIEMLASSKDLSDFVDKQQYRNSVQAKIRANLDKINELKQELTTQKETLDKLIADQQAMQAQLDSQRSEQNRLLAFNQNQQAAYEREIASNNSRIAELRRQQIAANARFTGGSTGTRLNIPDTSGYPWANVPFPNTMVDPWGMYKRQCVSYTAWKVWKSGRHMPYWGGRGNAKLWDDNAIAAGIPVDRNPRVGDVAVSNAGFYGHVMYVEAVHGDGTISISQYNASWDGRYSEARIPIGDLVFIHF